MDRDRPDVLSGLEAGVLGGIAMLAWFVAAMPLLGRPWYLILNLLAARFYPDRYVLLSPGMATWSGGAWLIFAAGLVGAIQALLGRGGWLYAFAVAAAWYLLSYFLVWKRLAPLLTVYVPQPVLLAGFLLYASVIGWRSRSRH